MIFQQPRFRVGNKALGESSLPVFQAKLAIVVLNNLVALAGGVLQFLAVDNLHCATGVLDEAIPLQGPADKLTVDLSVPSIVARKS